MARASGQDGQATVEFVGLLPLLALLGVLLWQTVVAGQAVGMAGAAAREAARARALGADPAAAARRVLPDRLSRGLRVRDDGDGVRLRIVVPAVVGHLSVGSVSARAEMEPQA